MPSVLADHIRISSKHLHFIIPSFYSSLLRTWATTYAPGSPLYCIYTKTHTAVRCHFIEETSFCVPLGKNKRCYPKIFSFVRKVFASEQMLQKIFPSPSENHRSLCFTIEKLFRSYQNTILFFPNDDSSEMIRSFFQPHGDTIVLLMLEKHGMNRPKLFY